MVNPLSRVAMKNIIEKEKNENNVVVKKDIKTLNDFATTTEQKINTISSNSYSYNRDNYNIKSTNNYNTNNINIKSDEQISSLIRNIVHGEVKIKENNSINRAITLEEAAEKAKK